MPSSTYATHKTHIVKDERRNIQREKEFSESDIWCVQYDGILTDVPSEHMYSHVYGREQLCKKERKARHSFQLPFSIRNPIFFSLV
jgi:hypothetical protein